MNIVHAVVSLDPAQGGPPAVALRLAAAQAALGHEVAIVSHDAPGRHGEVQSSVRAIPGIERVALRSVPAGLTLRTLVPRATKRLVREHVGQADIAHIHSVWEPLVREASLAARSAGVAYVVTPHGVLDPWCLAQRRLKKKIALFLTYRAMLNGAACLHLLNGDESALIEPLRLSAPRRVIPNGVFLAELEPAPPPGTFRSRHADLGNDPYVLFLSRLHFKKGLDHLAEAFARVAGAMPSARLVVAGPDGGAQADFQRRVAEAGISARVHIVGPLWGRDKFAAMADAACFCLPSRQEGFSMAILEAMACGTPAVISDACHFPEVAGSGAGVVVPMGASFSEALADALASMLRSPVAARLMGERGRDLVRTRFTWPVIAGQSIDMYTHCLRGGVDAAAAARTTAA